ncbi:MAG TPA: NADH-quinone oxidoreductase subunit N [Armatimonadota bacterium]|nr:NADH-quinone oxidoreductase subunit N [Armatimonadota bacterium]
MPINLSLLVPEIATLGLALAVLGAHLAWPRLGGRRLGVGAAIGAAIILAVTFARRGVIGETMGGLYLADHYAVFFRFIFLLAVVLVSLTSADFVEREVRRPGEYYALLLFSATGFMLMAGAGDLLTLYLGLELGTISLYPLAGYLKRQQRSGEAGLKFMLVGAVSSATLLYGISLVYGAAGTTVFAGLREGLMQTATPLARGFVIPAPALALGIAFIIAGFSFKLVAVPFHMWAPDVYHGAPTPITAYLSVASKCAGFAVVGRVLLGPLLPAAPQWALVLAGLSFASMFYGNVVAIPQTNIKRMLAYSGIAQAGYLLVGFAAASPFGAASALFYLLQYTFANIGAFTVVTVVAQATGREDIAGYSGLSRRSPALGFALLLLLLSLGGIPPLAGFWAKLYVFAAGIEQGLWWLVTLGVLTTVMSLYYYLMVIKHAYIFDPVEASPIPIPRPAALVLLICVVAVLVLAYPRPVLGLAEVAVRGFFGG